MKFDQYQSYKKTNIPLFREIPTTWNVVALQYISRLKSGSSITALDFDEEAKYPVYGGNGFRGLIDKFTHDGTYVLIGRQGALCGNINIAKEKFFATEHALVVTPTIELNTSWLAFTLTAMELNQYSVSAAQPGLSAEVLARLKIALPSIQEQQKIADFLDFKTAQIDVLIAKKEALLLKLQEKRSALITQAVTKGINPNVPMKPSGVEWLGDVPAHWDVKRMRYALTTNPSKNELDLKEDDLVSFIPMEAVGEYGGLVLETEKEVSEIGSGYTYFKDEDVVVAKITPCFENGKGAIAKGLKNKTAFGTTELHVLRASAELNPDFLFQLTISYPFRKIGESEMYGAGGQKRVPETFIKDFKIGFPPLAEQLQIVEYIKQKNDYFERQFKALSDAISRLTEYRAALITNAVTGKIDVRDFDLNKTNS